jgi:hypothetical protein
MEQHGWSVGYLHSSTIARLISAQSRCQTVLLSRERTASYSGEDGQATIIIA